MWMFLPHACGAHEIEKRVSDPLEPGLQMVVSQHEGDKIEAGSSGRGAGSLNTETILQPL